MYFKFPRLLLIVGMSGLIAMTIWPFHDAAQRYGLPLSFLAAWTAGLWYLRRLRFFQLLLGFLPLLAAIPFCLPTKPMDREKLRDRYVAAMGNLQGTRYLWGGEGHLGIDCSGLARRALRDALWETGSETGNGAAFREWARQWWFDTSAKALGEGYRGFTQPVGVAGKLAEINTNSLQPGDLAITSDGRHVMVYFGGARWIQADPIAFKVTLGQADPVSNPWFGAMVSMHRWTILE